MVWQQAEAPKLSRNGAPRYRVFITRKRLGPERADNEKRRFVRDVIETEHAEVCNGAFGKRGVRMLLEIARRTIAQITDAEVTYAIHEWSDEYGTWPTVVTLEQVED